MEEIVRETGFDISGRLERAFGEVEKALEEMKGHEDWRARIAAMAEMRRHIALASRTMEIAMRAEALKEFQRGVLEALAEAGVTVRKRVMGMFERRSDGVVE